MRFKIARTTGSGHCLAGCGGRQVRLARSLRRRGFRFNQLFAFSLFHNRTPLDSISSFSFPLGSTQTHTCLFTCMKEEQIKSFCTTATKLIDDQNFKRAGISAGANSTVRNRQTHSVFPAVAFFSALPALDRDGAAWDFPFPFNPTPAQL
jgi:hypothetical protein